MDKNKLKFEFDKNDKKIAQDKQLVNIEAFKNLDRKGLEAQVLERRLHLYTTEFGEKVYIQYPGLESKVNGERVKPWDFRPEVQNKEGEWMKNQSFSDIWNEIDKFSRVDDSYLSLIAALFIRCSFLLDTKYVEEDYNYEDIDKTTNKIVNRGKIRLKWYKLTLDEECIDYLSKKIKKVAGNFSMKSFLLMNDLLCQNEDCKYYYRDKIQKHGEWNPKVGRHNTYRTHVSIINYHKGNYTFSKIMGMFRTGVAPITDKNINDATDGIVKKKEK